MAYATSTYLILAALAASTAATMYSTDTQANQAEANAKFQADQAAADAEAEKGAALVEAERIRKAAKAQRAQAVAAAAASGVDVESPTAVKLDQEITSNAEEDALLTILNGSDKAARLNQQAYADRQAGSIAKSNARMQNTGTLLSAVASAAGSYGSSGGWKKAA